MLCHPSGTATMIPIVIFLLGLFFLSGGPDKKGEAGAGSTESFEFVSNKIIPRVLSFIEAVLN